MFGRLLVLVTLTLALLLFGGAGPSQAPGRPFVPAMPLPGTPPAVPAEAAHLVDLAEYAPELILDIRYAREDNAFEQAFYSEARALLARGTAAKLRRAADALAEQGYLLVVWDAYRPLSVQRAMWRKVPDPRYVADPARGSRHNRAAAVDVTLADRSGELLAMPTDFDGFGPAADLAWDQHPAEVRARAMTLRQAMREAGFLPYSAEWWHFSDKEWANYQLLDIPLDTPVPRP